MGTYSVNKEDEYKNKNTNGVGQTATEEQNIPSFAGVDQSVVDAAYTPFTKSDETSNLETKRNQWADTYETKINTGFQQSDSVTKAFQWLAGQEEYFKNGKTTWDDKIFGQIDKIENREKFVYDVDKDPLFQQALASAMGSGKSAMQDTIGQASALTGGYGSTYATSAGNQAYNAFIEDAYANLPQYYQMALEAYQAEGEEMYNLLGVYTQMGETEWNRNVDSYGIVSDSANNQRNWEFGLYQDDIANTYNVMNMYDSFYQQKNNEDLALWTQTIDNAWKSIGQLSSDYQFQTEFDYREERDGVSDSQWKDSFDESKRQFNYSIGDTNNDGVVSDSEKAAVNTKYTYDESGNPVIVKDDNIPLDDIEVDPETGEIINIKGYTIAGSGSNDKNSNAPTVKGFKAKDGDNFKITIGDNTYKVENEGKVESEDTLKKIEAGETYGNITIATNGHAYIKWENDYYRIGNRNIIGETGISAGSGYNDLLLALTK